MGGSGKTPHQDACGQGSRRILAELRQNTLLRSGCQELWGWDSTNRFNLGACLSMNAGAAVP